VLPGLVLLVLIVSVNVLGDRLRDVLNPHLRG
jgi:peptide/nickel transport system permease protein